MQDRIRSKKDNDELWKNPGTNSIYECFELVGIYHEYVNDEMADNISFAEYYIKCTSRKCYHYRNVGVKLTHQKLEEEYIGLYNKKYKVSKSSMRRYGITYANAPVYVYESSYIIAQLLLKIISEHEILKDVYRRYITNHNFEEDLSFQNKCVIDYICTAETTKQRYYRQMWGTLRDLLTKEHIDEIL